MLFILKKENKSNRGLSVFKHLTGLLIGAYLLQTLPLQISHLQLLQPARVVPPSPDQDAMSLIWIQKDYQTEEEGRVQLSALDWNFSFGRSKTLIQTEIPGQILARNLALPLVEASFKKKLTCDFWRKILYTHQSSFDPNVSQILNEFLENVILCFHPLWFCWCHETTAEEEDAMR